jgi:hypothetical protein
MVKQSGNENAVYDERYIVAHQHGTDKGVGVTIEEGNNAMVYASIVTGIHLGQHTVA